MYIIKVARDQIQRTECHGSILSLSCVLPSLYISGCMSKLCKAHPIVLLLTIGIQISEIPICQKNTHVS